MEEKSKSILISVAFLLFLPFHSFSQSSFKPSNERHFDLLHTELFLVPNFSNQTLKGNAKLELKPYFYAQNKLSLDAKGMIIEQIKLNGVPIKTYEYDSLQIAIDLGKSFYKTDTLNIEIDYLSQPNLINNIEKLKNSQYKGLYFITSPVFEKQQLWSEGETNYNSCWFPTIDSPNEKHTQTIHLQVDNRFKTLSNGLLVSSKELPQGQREDTWEQKLVHSVYLTMIAVGDFEKVIDPKSKDLEVSYYVEPEFKDDALGFFGNTPEMISFFETLLDTKYPWDKYAQIAVKEYISGAMENTSATVHGANIQKHKSEQIDNTSDGVIAHELFHHWFGDLVTCESWANLSLNEAFADYSEQLWMQHKYGKEEGEWTAIAGRNSYLEEAKEKKVPIIRYRYNDEEDLFDNHTYAKGGRVLHMLRKELGDEAFFYGLKIYLKEHAFENVEINDLREAMEKSSGKDLQLFFQQWFLSPGHPVLHIEHKIENSKLSFSVQQLQADSSIVFSFPLEILIGSNNGEQLIKVNIKEAEEYFEVVLNNDLTYLVFDPEGSLLAEIEHEKSEEFLINQFNSTKYLFPRLEAFNKLSNLQNSKADQSLSFLQNKKLRDLMLQASNDSYWRLREMAVQSFFDYDGEDFLAVEKQLQHLIKTDKRSQVRASSILAMKNFLNPQNDLLFREALNDSASLVSAAALEAILMNEPSDADILVERFRDNKDVATFGSVANYLSTRGNPEDLDWFLSKLKSFSGSQLYQVLGIMGTYLIQTNDITKAKAVPLLQQIATEEGMWFVRFQALQTLALISDIPQATKAIKKAQEQEKDERVLKLMKQFQF